MGGIVSADLDLLSFLETQAQMASAKINFLGFTRDPFSELMSKLWTMYHENRGY